MDALNRLACRHKSLSCCQFFSSVCRFSTYRLTTNIDRPGEFCAKHNFLPKKEGKGGKGSRESRINGECPLGRTRNEGKREGKRGIPALLF